MEGKARCDEISISENLFNNFFFLCGNLPFTYWSDRHELKTISNHACCCEWFAISWETFCDFLYYLNIIVFVCTDVHFRFKYVIKNWFPKPFAYFKTNTSFIRRVSITSSFIQWHFAPFPSCNFWYRLFSNCNMQSTTTWASKHWTIYC